MVGNIQGDCVALFLSFTAQCMRLGQTVWSQSLVLPSIAVSQGLWQESSDEKLRVRHCSQAVSELQIGPGCSADNPGEVSVQNIICAGLLASADLGIWIAL